MWLIPNLTRSAFAQESGCSMKAFEPDLSTLESLSEPLPMLSGKPLLPASFLRSWKREPFMKRLCGAAIFDTSTRESFEAWWMASLPDSPARTSALPADVRGSTENAQACSSTSSTLPTLAVRGSSLWRTSAPSLLPPPPLWTKPKGLSKSARPPESWENWPTAGGIRNGSLFQRPTWVPAMAETGGSALPGGQNWPTPMVGAGENSHGQISGDYRRSMDSILKSPTWATPDCNTSTYSNGKMGPNIREQASQWLTPNVPNVPNGGRSVSEALVQSKGMTEDGEKRTINLESQTRHWPSPRATDGTKGGPNQAGSKGDLMLPSAAAQWPTPKTITGGANSKRAERGAGGAGGAGGADLQEIVQQWDSSLPVLARPTPASRDYRTPNKASYQERSGTTKGEQLANFVAHSPSSPQAQPIQDGQQSCESVPTLRRRLNPAFGCWLMGWPVFWTNPGITNSVRSEMVSYQLRQQSQLSCLFGEPLDLNRSSKAAA